MRAASESAVVPMATAAFALAVAPVAPPPLPAPAPETPWAPTVGLAFPLALMEPVAPSVPAIIPPLSNVIARVEKR